LKFEEQEIHRQRALYDFNDTRTGYPRDKTIHVLFEEQVEKFPDRVAVLDTVSDRNEIS
jgi:iturin family lipopeptide synthetase B